jgi:hypothetical protein
MYIHTYNQTRTPQKIAFLSGIHKKYGKEGKPRPSKSIARYPIEDSVREVSQKKLLSSAVQKVMAALG